MEEKISASDWADYLMRIGAINSYAEYAAKLIDDGYEKIRQDMADQPEETPDAWELLAWAHSTR